MKLKGKVAIVTGASKGIGAAIAEDLAKHGASVVVNYGNSAKAAETVVKRITDNGGAAVAVQGDIRKESDIDALFAAAKQTYGKVDILVNNAGVYELRPIGEVDIEHIERQFSLNVTGLLLATKAAVKAFGDGGGSIVQISSSIVETPAAGGSVYASTKGAVNTITRALAQELGSKKIRVNAVSPGMTVTEGVHEMAGSGDLTAYATTRTPLGRLGQPADIVGAVTFLASDEAGWVTGQILGVNGGLTL